MATLYGNPENFRTQKVLAAAKYGGVKLNVKNSDPPKDVSPFGITPAYDDGKKKMWSSAGVALQVSGDALKGQCKESHTLVAQWVDTAETHFLPAVLGWVLNAQSLVQMDKKSVDAAKSELLSMLGIMNEYLLTRTFLVGERISLADLSLAFNLLPAFEHVLDEGARSSFGNVTRWFNTIMGQPNVKSVCSFKLCDKPAQFDGKKFNELRPQVQGGAGGGGDQKGGKGGKKKEAAPPKEEMDPAEEALAAEPKKKDPFEQFPKGNFNWDEFKRVYSNEDTESKAIPYFWDHFEKDTMSIWYCEYKYPKELTLVFMSCNLISGMMQRLDKMRKNSFGSMALFGENNNSTISGIWFWRGHELAFELSPDWQIDYESYEWKKLDPEDAKTKKLVKEYFLHEGDFDGKVFNQGKIFK
jgi:elongation factor 1-gamma